MKKWTASEGGKDQDASQLAVVASLPLAGLYMYRSKSDLQARDAVNEYLGIRPGEMEPLAQDDLDIRGLVAQGRPIEAIRLVRERRGCSLAEAKRIVDQMKA